MKTVKVMTSAQRADWLTRDPEGYFAFVRQEAAEVARRSHRKHVPAQPREPLVDHLWRSVPAALILVALLWVYIFARVLGVEW